MRCQIIDKQDDHVFKLWTTSENYWQKNAPPTTSPVLGSIVISVVTISFPGVPLNKVFRAFLLVMSSCSLAFAQLANTTSLTGTATDASGASAVGVAITAVNTDTNDTYKTITNSDGNYTIEFIKIGKYSVTAVQNGFETLVKNGIVVDSNQIVRTDFSLQVGRVSEQVVVSGTAPPLSTDDASVREVVSQRSIAELPLNGRDPLRLATLAPGVLPGQKAANGIPPGEDFIAAGTREIQNSISLDGIATMNNLITTSPFHPSPDAIQELEVQSGNYSAQYGGYLGAHLNLITKSGANQVHGAVWEFFRNDVLDARNFFLSPSVPKPPLRQSQFGGEFGGPLFVPKLYDGRNKTFFMFDYEGLRLRKQANGLDTVLTPLMRQGNFTESSTALKSVNGVSFPGNIIPASMLSPQALKLLQYMPLPNVPGSKSSSGLGVRNNYSATYPNNDSFNQFLGRLDQNFGEKTRFFFRYANNDETYLTGATGPYNGTYLPVVTQNWVVGYTQTLTPNMVNDIRVGRQHLTTDALNYWATNNLTTAGTDLGIPGFNGDTAYADPGIPFFNNSSSGGFMALGNGGTNWIQFDTTWQGTDSFTYTHGAHTVIVGAEVRKLITSRSATNNPNGNFNFTGFYTGNAGADFLLGYVQSDTTAGPEIRNQVAEWRDGFFVVDNWQASRKLTLNLGLRYELPTVPYTVNGYATILNATQTALIPSTVPQPGFSFTNPTHKDFAPRFGLAYRATDKTVIRAGFGIYYNPNQTNTFTFLSSNPPFAAVISCTATLAAPLTLANPSPASACGTAKIFNVITPNRNLPTPYMNQWTFGVQQGLWNSAALDIQYIGSHTLHLDRSYYNNTPLPGSSASVAPRRPNQLFGDIRTIQNDEISNYEGVSVELRQRFSHGITALASYTWSHDLDVSTDSNNGGYPQNPYNWRADYGNANWDLRHRFVGSFTYALPFLLNSPHALLKQTLGGWQTNGIVTLQSGFPFNVTSPGDPANTGRSSERPNVTGPAYSNCGSGSLTNCISTNFAVATYAYGNFGRNVLYGPGFYNVDFSAFKNFSIKERATVQFRSEFFNLLNTPAFSNPNATITNSNFGTITSTKSDNRQIQFALKLLF